MVVEITPPVTSPYWAGSPPVITSVERIASRGILTSPRTFTPSINITLVEERAPRTLNEPEPSCWKTPAVVPTI